MKFKKILAIALAATTALTLVPANVAEAKQAMPQGGDPQNTVAYLDSGDQFTATIFEKSGGTTADDRIVATFTVDTAVWNHGLADTNAATKNLSYQRDNSTYKNGRLEDHVTTDGTVKLTALAIGGNIKAKDLDTDGTVTLPLTVKRYPGADTYKSSGKKVTAGAVYADTEKDFGKNGSDEITSYRVSAVELDGSNTNVGAVTTFSFEGSDVSKLTSLKLENFEKLANITIGDSQSLSKLEKFSVKGSAFTVENAMAVTTKATITNLKAIDISGLQNQSSDDAKKNAKVNLTGATNLEEINVAETATSELTVPGNKGLVVNISDTSNLTSLDVQGSSVPAKAAYNSPVVAKDAVSFIVNGSDKTKDLDMSGWSGMKHLKVTGVGLVGFTAPSYDSKSDGAGDLDVSGNSIAKINLSNASDALNVDFSDNMLLDADISGLSAATRIDASNNYLTALDVTGNEKLSTFECGGNFLTKDTLVKDSGQTAVSLGTQEDVSNQMFFAYTGDMGQGLNSDTKATINVGGSGTLMIGFMNLGAPDGFAEKLAATLDVTDSNSAETSAVTLGEKTILKSNEEDYTPANNMGGGVYVGGYKSLVLATVPVTGNAEKKAADKITVSLGNAKKVVNINTDSVVTVAYDIESAIEKETLKKNNDTKLTVAPFFYPQTAYVLGANGTVNATLQSAKPGDETPASAPMVIQALDPYKLKGLSFDKWNTAADGSGEKLSANGRIKDLAESTTVYAQFTENTYNISFTKDNSGGTDGLAGSAVTVSGSTTTQSKVAYGDEVALNSNGSTTTKGNFYGWKNADSNVFYSDGQTVQGIALEPDKKSSKATLSALYGEADHYVSTDVTSLTLTVGDPYDGAFSLDDLKPTVTGAPTDGDGANDQRPNINLNCKVADGKFQLLTGDSGIAEIKGNYIVAKGAGTTNVYVLDKAYGNVATVSVTVYSKEQAASDAEAKAKAAAVNKAIAAGDKTDVTAYSKTVSEVKINADGTDTVTVTKGNKSAKTVNLATKLVVGDKEYTITQVAANAYKSAKLTTLKTGNSVKTIGASAFANAKKLKKVTLGKKVAKIGKKAFYNTVKLTTVSVATKKLTKTSKVGANAFKNAGKSVNTKVNFTKAVTKKAAKSQRTVLRKRGLKKYGKKKATYTWKSKKF